MTQYVVVFLIDAHAIPSQCVFQLVGVQGIDEAFHIVHIRTSSRHCTHRAGKCVQLSSDFSQSRSLKDIHVIQGLRIVRCVDEHHTSSGIDRHVGGGQSGGLCVQGRIVGFIVIVGRWNGFRLTDVESEVVVVLGQISTIELNGDGGEIFSSCAILRIIHGDGVSTVQSKIGVDVVVIPFFLIAQNIVHQIGDHVGDFFTGSDQIQFGIMFFERRSVWPPQFTFFLNSL